MSGFITIHRKFLEWEWYSDKNTKTLFLHCLLKANWDDKNWHGIDIKRGSFVTSIGVLSSETKLTIKQVRLCFSKLEKSGELVKKTTNKFTLVTIVKYGEYQDLENKKTNKGQTKDKQRATTNHYNNNNHITNNRSLLDERKLKFASTLEPFLANYGREMLNDFYKYWTEENKSNTKFKQELEKTWSLERRLETWSKNDYGNKKEKSSDKKESEITLAGRQTISTIQQNLSTIGLVNPYVEK